MNRIALVLLIGMFVTTAQAQRYSLTPSLTENPISDNGQWLNGQQQGIQWNDVQTKPGMIFSAWLGNAGSAADSTAILNGIWGQNQTATATINCPSQVNGQEVELRLNSTLYANHNDGYEINFSCGRDKYVQIVKWNGPLNSYSYLWSSSANATIKTGDVIKAARNGGTINVYKNGTLVAHVADSTFLGGAPGLGFWRDGSGANQNFGFSNFTADDGSLPPPPPIVPNAPANVGSSVQVVTTATISWQAVSSATSYKVYRGTGSGGPYALRGSVTGTTFSETLTTGNYYYVITALNAAGESQQSPEVWVGVQ